MTPSSSRRLSGAGLPLGLLDLPEPPSAVFVRGEISHAPTVALVGTRHPTPEASAYARQLARCLAACGVVVASGGASGIDTAVHEGALEVGGKTLVVAPSSFDRPYPAANAELFARVITERGGYVSAFQVNSPARRSHFFARNSYLVALSHAVVMVEAPVRSGARNAALWARRLRRPLFVVPATPWNTRGLGCIVELKLGARPLFSHRDVLECLKQQNLHCVPEVSRGLSPVRPSLAPEAQEHEVLAGATRAVRSKVARDAGAETRRRERSEPTRAAARASLEPTALRVLEAVEHGSQHPDEICALLRLPAHRVQELLLTLTLRKVLVAHPAGTYRIAGR